MAISDYDGKKLAEAFTQIADTFVRWEKRTDRKEFLKKRVEELEKSLEKANKNTMSVVEHRSRILDYIYESKIIKLDNRQNLTTGEFTYYFYIMAEANPIGLEQFNNRITEALKIGGILDLDLSKREGGGV